MSTLTSQYEYLIKRIKLLDEFRDTYQDSDVFDEDMRSKFTAYFKAYEDYYAFKPFIKAYVDNDPKKDVEMEPLANLTHKRTSIKCFFDGSEQNQSKLHELKMEVIRNGSAVNHLLDQVGFKIIQYLGEMENLYPSVDNNIDQVLVSQGLGERVCIYLSVMAQKAWLRIIIPNEPEGCKEDVRPLYLFTKTKFIIENEEPQNDNHLEINK